MAVGEIAFPGGANEATHQDTEIELALASIAHQREVIRHALVSPETVGEAELSRLGVDPDLALSIDPAYLLFKALSRLERDERDIRGEDAPIDKAHAAAMRVHHATRLR